MAKNLQSPMLGERAPVDFSQWLIAKLYSLPLSRAVRRTVDSTSKVTVSKELKSIIVRELGPYDPLQYLGNKAYVQPFLYGERFLNITVWPRHTELGGWESVILSRNQACGPIWVNPPEPKKQK